MKKLLLVFVVLSSMLNLAAARKVVGDYAQNGMFGSSVAMDGDWAAIGSRDWHDGSSPICGSVYMFKRTSDEWNTDWLRAQLIEDPSQDHNGHFGHDVDMSGNYMIVGSDYAHESHVFKLDAGTWGSTVQLINPASSNFFGRAVAITSDVAVVGANAGTHAGTAYVYHKDLGGLDNWGQVKQLLASDSENYDYFGMSVDVDGDNIIVGAYGGDKAYIFNRNQGGADNWGEVQILEGNDINPGDDFGYAVAIDGNWAAVAAKGNNTIHIFLNNGGLWSEVTTLEPGYVSSLDFDFPNLIAGGTYSVTNDRAYVYTRDNNGNWNLEEEVIPVDDSAVTDFGSAVAISGNQFLVSDYQSDELPDQNGTEGAAYFYATEHNYDGKPWGQFTIINMEAGDGTINGLADWMYSEDGNPYLEGQWQTKVYAYQTMQWGTVEGGGRHQTEARLNQSGSDLLDGLNSEEVEINIDGLSLSSFFKINTEDLGQSWDSNNPIAAGDNRYYDGGNGEIKYLDVTKLKWENMMFNFTVPYPFEQTLGTSRVGTGGAITGYGQATLLVDECDEAWLAEFDPNGSGQIRFDIESFSPTTQGLYGYYTAEITINPVDFIQTYATEDVPQEGNDLDLPINFENAGVDFVFDSIDFGYYGEGNGLVVNFINEAPEDGDIPNESLFEAEAYWHFGTTLASFNTSITFDLDLIDSIQNNNGVRIYRREMLGDEWERWNDIELIGQTQIRALNVNGFSDWMVASEDDQSLPVEMASFFAVQTSSDSALLSWSTESETELLGYNVLRNENTNLTEAIKMNSSIIAGQNNSTTTSYSYDDQSVELERTYYYWLEAVDMDGTTEFFGPASVTLKSDGDDSPEIQTEITELKTAYPNPFSISSNSRSIGTTIKFSVKEGETGILSIFNLRGQLLENKTFKAGEHEHNWNANKFGSGIYFYKLKTDSYHNVKKMMVVK